MYLLKSENVVNSSILSLNIWRNNFGFVDQVKHPMLQKKIMSSFCWHEFKKVLSHLFRKTVG